MSRDDHFLALFCHAKHKSSLRISHTGDAEINDALADELTEEFHRQGGPRDCRFTAHRGNLVLHLEFTSVKVVAGVLHVALMVVLNQRKPLAFTDESAVPHIRNMQGMVYAEAEAG